MLKISGKSFALIMPETGQNG